MHKPGHDSSEKKRDLRDQPSTSLRDTNVESALQDPEEEKSGDLRRPRSGPDIVKPGPGGQQAPGQTSHE